MTTKHQLNIICSALLTVSLVTISSASTHTGEMAERLRACAGCHDRIGAETSDENYVPSINGKPVEYLYQQLLNYREGRRQNAVMNQMLAYLSTEYLHEIAHYYAQQELSYRSNHSDDKKQNPDAIERARFLVHRNDGEQAGCTACHGGDLRGNGITIPSLRELSASYITAQLGAWKAGNRHAREPDCMADVAKSLSGTDVNAVARWIANVSDAMLEPQPPMEPLPAPCGAVQ